MTQGTLPITIYEFSKFAVVNRQTTEFPWVC